MILFGHEGDGGGQVDDPVHRLGDGVLPDVVAPPPPAAGLSCKQTNLHRTAGICPLPRGLLMLHLSIEITCAEQQLLFPGVGLLMINLSVEITWAEQQLLVA